MKSITSAKDIKDYWNKHAFYTHDNPKDGGRARWLAIGLDGHLIIGMNIKDFACALWSHEMGRHKYCLPY